MLDGTPYLPPSNPEVEAALGRFIIAWGALEGQIDGVIHDLLLTDIKTGLLVTANLAIRAKLDLAHALFEQLRCDEEPVWCPFPIEWEKRFDEAISQTARANAEARIPIVHSIPQIIRIEGDGDETDQDIPIWVRMVARKGGLRGSGVTYSREFLDEHTALVVELAQEWGRIRARWKTTLEAFRSADADEWLSRPPGERDHLNLQLQSKSDSPPATPKLPRQPKPSRRAKREAREAQTASELKE